MKKQKLLTVYPVTDKEVKSLGFNFMVHSINAGCASTTYYKDKATAAKMLKQLSKVA